MKKSKIKFAIKKAFNGYYEKGLPSTAHFVRKEVMKAVDDLYKK